MVKNTINQVSIAGYIQDAPNAFFTRNRKRGASLVIKTSGSYESRREKFKNDQLVSIVAFGYLAKKVLKLESGQLISVKGELRIDGKGRASIFTQELDIPEISPGLLSKDTTNQVFVVGYAQSAPLFSTSDKKLGATFVIKTFGSYKSKGVEVENNQLFPIVVCDRLTEKAQDLELGQLASVDGELQIDEEGRAVIKTRKLTVLAIIRPELAEAA